MSNPERPAAVGHGNCALRLLLRGGMLLGVLVAVLQAVLLGPILPDPIVARFAWDGSGRAWTSPSTFLTIHLVVIASSAAVFISLPLLLRAAAWWQRASDTDAHHASRLTDFEQWTLLFGLVTTTFALGLVQYVAVANLARPPQLADSFPLLVTTYLAFAATWTVQVVRRFRRHPAPVSATVPA